MLDWRDGWAKFTNWIENHTGKGTFDEEAYNDVRCDPCVVIGQEQFNTMKDSLKNAINLESAGLDDLMIKKILITYYRGLYLDDTDVLMELGDGTQADIDDDNKLNEILKANYGEGITAQDIKPYKCVAGDDSESYGKTGKIYIKGKGLIKIENHNGDDLVYYPEENLNQIFDKEYKGSFEDGEETDYSKSVRKYLEKCYTYAENGIKMYCFQEYEKTLELADFTHTLSESYTGSLVNIEFYDKISEYVTPIEFMINLMEVTGSQDYIDAFIEMVGNKCYVKLKLLEIKDKVVNTITLNRSRQINVYGKKPSILYSVKVELSDNSGNKYEEDVPESAISRVERASDEKIDITVTNTYNKKYNFIIYAKNEDGTVKKVSDKNIDAGKAHTFTEENPDQTIKNKETTMDIKIEEKEKKINKKYDIAIEKVSTWYMYMEVDNSLETSKTYYTINQAGEEIEVPDESSKIAIQQPDITKTYMKDTSPEYFKPIYQKITDRDAFDKNAIIAQTQLTINKSESGYNPDDYVFYQMDLKDYNNTITNLITKETKRAAPGNISKVEDKTDNFLAMLSNSTGVFNLNEGFVSKSAGGKIVRYNDLYAKNSKAGPGELLTNGAEMFFQLLEKSENTQGLTDIMRYIIYRYSGIDYGVTNFNFGVYEMQSMSGISILGDTIEDKVFYALKFAGYSDIAIAAVMGNMQGESGFRVDAIESNGEGHGLCQWSFGRKKQLMNFAQSRGTTWDNADIQIEFLLGEINPSGGADGYADFQMGGTHYGYTYNSWKDATDVTEATKAFMAVFERPNMNLAHTDRRVAAAKKYLEKYKDRDLSGGEENIEGAGNGILKRFTSNITGKTFTVYDQTNSIINLPGQCNRATAASIASGYRESKSEMEVIGDVKKSGNYVMSNANSTNAFFGKYGLKASINPCSYSMDNVKKYLMQGSYLGIWFKEEVYGKSGRKYSKANSCHWIGILGYKNEGGKEQIYISDSGFGNSGWKDIDEFEGCKNNIHYFTVVSVK